MANFQLVWQPLIISLVLFIGAGLFFIWLNKNANKQNAAGYKSARLFGFGLLILAGFSMFIFLFFAITQ